MVSLAEAMWAHGTSMQIEAPDQISKIWRAGFFSEVEGKPNTTNWFHFAIPTTVIVDDHRLRVGSVMLLFETLSPDAIVRDVHVYDGDTKIAEHNGVNLTGNVGFARFDVPTHPAIKWGLGITVGVNFGQGSGYHVMRFRSAGCDFIPLAKTRSPLPLTLSGAIAPPHTARLESLTMIRAAYSTNPWKQHGHSHQPYP